MQQTAVEQLAAEYSGKARAYADLWAPVLRPLSMPVLDRLPLAGAARVLDLGAGTGDLVDPLRVRAPESTILVADRSSGMLRVAAVGVRDARVVVDAQELPFAGGSVDVAVLAFVLFHIPDAAKCLREVGRVLRPGGAIGVVTWSESSALPGGEIWTEELDAVGAAPDVLDPTIRQHALMDSPAKVAALLEEGGFVDVDARETPFERSFTIDQLVELALGVGVARRRSSTLSVEDAARCRARVEARMQRLPSHELVFRAAVVWGTGRAPG